MKQRLLAVGLLVAAVAALALPTGSHAANSVKVTPLKYQQHVDMGKDKTGYMDVSNPSTDPLIIKMGVQGFRQIDTQGNLEFYNDERLTAGIVPELKTFTLGPREAIRLMFVIHPNILGNGGTYAALFAETQYDKVDGGSANVVVAARAGTLMILDVGNGGTREGEMKFNKRPIVAFGDSVTATVSYKNTGTTNKALAFNPNLLATTGWRAKSDSIEGPLVMPGNTREISVVKRGDFIGFIPTKVVDTNGGAKTMTQWTFAVTGYWQIVAPAILMLLAALSVGYYYWRQKR